MARPRFRRAVSLIEMLIALSVTAVLLLAVAAAFDASFSSYAQNQQMVDAQQSARVLMHRIMTQARRSTYLNVAADGQRIQVETADENYQYTYAYIAAARQLVIRRTNLDSLVIEDLGAVDNVVAFAIPSQQWRENPDRLTLAITVSGGANRATMTASAVPRSTITF